MHISVIICTYNGAKRLSATLEHLANQVVNPKINWEIILVDNNSTDHTFETSIETWNQFGCAVQFRPFKQPEPGKQRALELAYQEARGEFMCIVDDDNWLNSDYLQLGYELLVSEPAVGILGGRTVGAFEATPPSWFPQFQDAYAVGEPLNYSTVPPSPFTKGEVSDGGLWGAGLFVRRSIWQRLQALQFKSLFVGRIGEKQLTAAEDDELCYAARLLGYKIWYDPALVLTHFMAAGRLNEAYLKKIMYSPAYAQCRLLAYQRALTDPTGKYATLLPWAKDLVYMTKRLLMVGLSPSFWRTVRRGDKRQILATGRQALTWLQFLKEFTKAPGYYRQIIAIR